MSERRPLSVVLVTVATLGSGAINLYSVIGRSPPERIRWLREAFPLSFIHLSRFLTLLIGFALVVSSINIYKRKRRACQVVLLMSAFSAVLHLTKGIDYEGAAASACLFVLLLAIRPRFTVKSSLPAWKLALARLALAVAAALGYGIAGFWFLDPRELGINFTIGDAVHRTLLFLTFIGDPSLVPRTRYARWFLDSLELVTATVSAYAAFSLFRPALYQLRTLPQERERAASIVQRHGRSSLDFFKSWPDKSFFFSSARDAFVAYRVGGSYAVALGDPVGPEAEIEGTVRGFREFCTENDWGHCFYQTLPDYLRIYAKLGYHKLKVGDDALVDLTGFTLEGKNARNLRNRVSVLEKQGTTTARFDAPLPDDVLRKLKAVSDEWLEIPGRRERTFSVGKFEPEYVRATPVFVVRDSRGEFLAFANIVPSFCKGEAAIDLMRHRQQAPNGTMDFLFTARLRKV